MPEHSGFPEGEPRPTVFTVRQQGVVAEFADMMRGSEAEDALRIAIADQHAAYLKKQLLINEGLDLNDPLQWYVFMRGAMYQMRTINEELTVAGGDVTNIAEINWGAVDNAYLLLAALAPPEVRQEFQF